MVHSITFVKGEVIPRYDKADGRVHFTDKVNGEYPNERRTDVDWGLVPSNASFVQAPEPKEYILEVDGIDNDGIDYSDAVTGRTLYKSRQGEWKFYRQALRNWSVGLPEIVNWLQGKKVSIITDDDPSYYYVGRITVSLESNEYWATVTMKYKLEAYKKYVYPSYQLDIEGPDPVTLTPFDKKIYPVVWDLIDFEDAHDESAVCRQVDYIRSDPEIVTGGYNIIKLLTANGMSFEYLTTLDLNVAYDRGTVSENVQWVRHPSVSALTIDKRNRTVSITVDGSVYPVVAAKLDSSDYYARGGAVANYMFKNNTFNEELVGGWYIIVYRPDAPHVGVQNAALVKMSANAKARFVKNRNIVRFYYSDDLVTTGTVYSIRRLSIFDVFEWSINSSNNAVSSIISETGVSVGYANGASIEYVTETNASYVIYTDVTQYVFNFNIYDVMLFGTAYNEFVAKGGSGVREVISVSKQKLFVPDNEKPVVPTAYVNVDGNYDDPDLITNWSFSMINTRTGERFVSNKLNKYEAYQLRPGTYSIELMKSTNPGILLEWRKEKL